MKHLMNMLACLLTGLLVLNMPFGLHAQNKTVTLQGVITDESGEPLAGASVIVEGGNDGVMSDAEGRYSISVQAGKTLIYSFIGYKSESMQARSSRTLDVALVPDSKYLDESVVVGYGTMRRSDLTGSISSVSGQAIENYKTSSVLNALGGMVAGVNITSSDGTPGGGFDVKIRGVGTVTGETSPLYIVDGFEVSDINYLANQDIKSIEVLKDASASAIYGSRAANGVVLVTTKSGYAGRPEVSYSGSTSYRVLSKQLDELTPYEFVALQMELNPSKYATTYYREGNDAAGRPYRYQTIDDYIGAKGVDWQDEAFRPTWSSNHELSVRGGSKDAQYFASFSHYDEDGLFTNSSYEKNTTRVKYTNKILPWLTLTTSVDYSATRKTGVGTGGGTLSNLLMYRPVGGLYTSDYDLRHNAVDPILEQMNANNATSYNPIVNAEATDAVTRTDRVAGYGTLAVRLSKSLNWRTSGSYSLQIQRNDRFYKNGSSAADRGSGPYGYSQLFRYMRYGVSNQLQYSKTFARRHKLNAMLGQETYYNLNENVYGEAGEFPLDALGVNNLGLGAVAKTVSSGKTDSRKLSFFGRAFYNFDDRYMLTATVREDASSVFSSKHKWGFFPSFSAAWTASNEAFLKDAGWLSNLKLRAGWGLVGNDRISSYLSLSVYDSYKYGVGSSQVITFDNAHLANKDLKWEASSTTNVGIDAGLLDDRINLTVDAFVKDSKDLLLSQDLAYVSGFSSQWRNIGKLRNKGLEITLGSVNIQKRDFSWRTDFNISFIRNKLLNLESGKDYMYARTGFNSNFSSYDYIAEVGKSLGSMYGYVFDGVYQQTDFVVYADGTQHLKEGVADISDHAGTAVTPGFVKYKDIDGDGVITTNDRTVIGNGQPKGYGGLNNSFYFKGVDFSFMLQFCYGNDVYNAQRMYATQSDLEMMNMLGEVRHRWTVTNASNKVPSAKGYVRNDVYSRFIEDGSFLRLKNVTLGYTLPQSLTRKFYVKKLRFYATGENLLLLTKYSGYDPEVSMSSNPMMPGFDYGSYPKSRVITLGVEVNL